MTPEAEILLCWRFPSHRLQEKPIHLDLWLRARKLLHVDLRGGSDGCVEVGEISGLQSGHRFIRLGEVDPNRGRRGQGAARARDK